MNIEKKDLLYDIKLNKSTDLAFRRLMRYFADSTSGIDCENSEFAQNIYKSLGWYDEKQKYDVINSFWTTFSWAMHCKYPEKYPQKDAGNIGIYKNHNDKYNISSFPEKFIAKGNEVISQASGLIKDIPEIEEFSALCHCVGNFMPCPNSQHSFNIAKFWANGVNDYLPLMIDRIQNSIDCKKTIEYNYQNTNVCIGNEEIKVWQKWFIDNRVNYSFEPYYYVVKEEDEEIRIVGIPFFTRQSLKHPLPESYDEVKECLAEMVNRILYRVDLIEHKALKIDEEINR